MHVCTYCTYKTVVFVVEKFMQYDYSVIDGHFALCLLGVSLDSEIGPASVFHPPNKETLLNPTSTFGPKPFLFVVKPVSTCMYT